MRHSGPTAQQPWETCPVKGKVKSKAAFIWSYQLWVISVFWGGFLRLWLWQCTGQWEQFHLQETASTRSWMSLLLHSVCYRTLRIAQEQTVISSQDGGNSACSGTFQAGWLSPTFPSTLPLFFCTLLFFYFFLLLFLQSAFRLQELFSTDF